MLGPLQRGTFGVTKSNNFIDFLCFSYLCIAAGCSIVFRFPITFGMKGEGKSGQLRAPCFLTGRYPRGYSSVTENNHPLRLRPGGKGEKVRQELTGPDGDTRSRTPDGLKDHVYRRSGLLVRCRGVGRKILQVIVGQDK